MAIPFSRPLHPGAHPAAQDRPRARVIRPGNPAGRHQQQQHQQQRQQQHQHQPSSATGAAAEAARHPIADFLFGDGALRLNRINRVTRLTLYVLYETWTLLQELLPEAPGQQGQGQGQQPQQQRYEPIVVNPADPSVILNNSNGVAVGQQERRHPQPDVVLDSTRQQLRNSPTTSATSAQQQSSNNYSCCCSSNRGLEECCQERGVKVRSRHHAQSTAFHLELNRRLKERSSRLRKSSFSTSDLPDLVADHGGDSVDNGGLKDYCDEEDPLSAHDVTMKDDVDEVDLGYFSANSSRHEAPGDDEDHQETLLKPDGGDDHDDGDGSFFDLDRAASMMTAAEAIVASSAVGEADDAWSGSARMLVEVASAFEVAYGVRYESEEERQVYEVFKTIKADALRRLLVLDSSKINVFEVGKAVFCQALLTGMWFLIKKIKVN